MEGPTGEFQLENIAHQHGIAAEIFIPCVIERLGVGGASESSLTVRLVGIPGREDCERHLRLWWLPASATTLPLGIQENTVTEWAALGVACVVIDLYGGLRVRDVGTTGDRFDFWVIDGERDFGLEVSGTISAEVEARRREKVRQLLSNPHGLDGYVVVARFATRQVVFSHHRFTEGQQ